MEPASTHDKRVYRCLLREDTVKWFLQNGRFVHWVAICAIPSFPSADVPLFCLWWMYRASWSFVTCHDVAAVNIASPLYTFILGFLLELPVQLFEQECLALVCAPFLRLDMRLTFLLIQGWLKRDDVFLLWTLSSRKSRVKPFEQCIPQFVYISGNWNLWKSQAHPVSFLLCSHASIGTLFVAVACFWWASACASLHKDNVMIA